MRFDIVTILPEAFDGYLNTSILARAQARYLVDINIFNPRDYVHDPHRSVDDRPYGGGAGMVLMAEQILRTVQDIKRESKKIKKKKIVLFSAKGRQFNQKLALEWSRKYGQIILISGRYEGIDERVSRILKAEEISIGPYVLTDGDVPAMAVISSVMRLLPGAITFESLEEESFYRRLVRGPEQEETLEYPHYTRPEVVVYKGKKYRVPKALLSGNHAAISKWREKHMRNVKIKSQKSR